MSSQRTHPPHPTVLNDALRIVTGCLRPTPTDHLPILQPAELRRLGATLSLARRVTLDPDHILHNQLVGLPDLPQEKLKSRRSFVPAARKLLNNLSKLGIRAAQWTNYRWSAEYSKRTSVLHVFISFPVLGPLKWACPEHLGLSSIACRLALGASTHPCTNASRSLAQLRVWGHRSNRRPRYHNMPHTSGISRGDWSDSFG